MIQTKLLKLAKRLTNFNYEDFLIMSNEDEEIVKPFLDRLISEGRIKQTGKNSYTFVDVEIQSEFTSVKKITRRIIFSNSDIKNLFFERENLPLYKNASEPVKKIIDKYLFLLKEAKNMLGDELEEYILNKWNKEHPVMQTTARSFMRAKSQLKNFGIAGVVAASRYGITKINKHPNEKIYQEFKKYFLENKNLSIKYCYIKFRAEYFEKHPDDMIWEFPSYQELVIRIRKDVLNYKNLDFTEILGDKKSKSKIVQKKIGFVTFKAATNDYIEDLSDENNPNKVHEDTLKHYKYYVSSNLIHYFRKTRLNDITEEVLQDLKDTLEDYRCSKREVEEQISLVRKIVQVYASDNSIFPSMTNLSSEFKKHINTLDKEQVQILLKTCKKKFPDFYPLILTALNTGLTRGEVLALTWDKFDEVKKILRVDKTICNGEVIKVRTKHAIRNIDLPDKLIEILLKMKENSKGNLIFPDKNGNLQDPDFMIKYKFQLLIEEAGFENIRFIDLRDTFSRSLIEQNLPITYVMKQMGVNNIKDFVAKYQKFIPEIKRGNFCLI